MTNYFVKDGIWIIVHEEPKRWFVYNVRTEGYEWKERTGIAVHTWTEGPTITGSMSIAEAAKALQKVSRDRVIETILKED